MLGDKKNLLILFLGIVICFFAFFSYKQNETISIMNKEITNQADHVQNVMLNKYAIERKNDTLSVRIIELKSSLDILKMKLKNQE